MATIPAPSQDNSPQAELSPVVAAFSPGSPSHKVGTYVRYDTIPWSYSIFHVSITPYSLRPAKARSLLSSWHASHHIPEAESTKGRCVPGSGPSTPAFLGISSFCPLELAVEYQSNSLVNARKGFIAQVPASVQGLCFG